MGLPALAGLVSLESGTGPAQQQARSWPQPETQECTIVIFFFLIEPR